jgi:hypothetical protein
VPAVTAVAVKSPTKTCDRHHRHVTRVVGDGVRTVAGHCAVLCCGAVLESYPGHFAALTSPSTFHFCVTQLGSHEWFMKRARLLIRDASMTLSASMVMK